MLLGSHHEVTDIPGLRQLCRLKLLLQKKTPPKKSSKAHLFKNHHHAYYEMATSTLLGILPGPSTSGHIAEVFYYKI